MKFRYKAMVSPVLLSAALFLVACKKEESAAVTETHHDSTAVLKDTAVAQNPAPAKANTDYTAVIIPPSGKKKDSVISALKKQYSSDELYTILALNRLDKKNIGRGDTLMIPNKFAADFLAYSPFPGKADILNDVNKIVIFSYPIQAYGVYENGILQKWGPTSMGSKNAQTKRGLMFTNWKKELSISSVKSEWKLPYNFNIHNTLGIGWHQYDLPGFPASHSCLRLLESDAKWLYKFADQWILAKDGDTEEAKGTPVIVFGDYAWGKSKPWKHLDENPHATDISEQQLTEIVQPYKAEIIKQQERRAQVVSAKEAKKAVKDSASSQNLSIS